MIRDESNLAAEARRSLQGSGWTVGEQAFWTLRSRTVRVRVKRGWGPWIVVVRDDDPAKGDWYASPEELNRHESELHQAVAEALANDA